MSLRKLSTKDGSNGGYEEPKALRNGKQQSGLILISPCLLII